MSGKISKVLRMEMSLCANSHKDTPEIYADEIMDNLKMAANFTFPVNGKRDAFSEYHRDIKRDWLIRLLRQLKRHVDTMLEVLCQDGCEDWT